jgi:iron complex outermembrane receptor protein
MVEFDAFISFQQLIARVGSGKEIKSLLAGLAALLIAHGAEAQSGPSANGSGPGLDEVLVTAERHKSTVQETPVSITAVSGEDLADRGLASVEDVMREIAGLSIRTAGPGQTEYESRGMASNGGASPTVGFYLNDIPLSPPPNGQTGKVVIDPDLYDINRIEVLRGPQGTLYGSGSMGGTIRVITNSPKLDTYQASMQVIGSGTVGGGPNGTVNVMVNVPIVENTLSLRVVGGETYRSGFVDRIVLDPFPLGPTGRGDVTQAPAAKTLRNVNDAWEQTARAELLFVPNDTLDISATAYFQRMNQGGYDEFESPPGSRHLAIYQAFDLKEPISDTIGILSLSATQRLGFADLTSVSSIWHREQKQLQDSSENEYYDFGYQSIGAPIIPQTYSEHDYAAQFTQELRLSSPENSSSPLTWVTGLFFSDLHALWLQWGANPQGNTINQLNQNAGFIPDPAGIILNARNPYRLTQDGVFGSATYSITDHLKATVGLRWDHYDSTELNNESGFGFPTVTPLPDPIRTHGSGGATTPRFNLSYVPDKDLTVYATVAQGYRTGGANQYSPPPPVCNPASAPAFKPDSTWNYELGEKARLFDGRLTLNGDIYFIRWYGVQQLFLLACGYEYYYNAGDGRSFGPELEAKFKINKEWTLSAEGSYTDAALTDPSPQLAAYDLANALPGTLKNCTAVGHCTLPILNVPRYSGSVSLLYTRPVADGLVAMARLTDSYVGPAIDESFYPIVDLQPYNIINFRAGLNADKWSAAFFANNLTNKHAQLSANNTSFQWNTPGYYRVSTNQPLTLGLDLSYRF